MREVIALVAREGRVLKKPILAMVSLSVLYIAYVFTVSGVGGRYQLFDARASMSVLLLMGAVLLGLGIALVSFVQEMTSGTWDGLLLLPCSRGLWLATKLGVGLAVITAGLAAPPLVLRAMFELSHATGGPLPGAAELLVQMRMGDTVLMGVATYLAAASGGLLMRERPFVLVCHAAIPMLGFLAVFERPRGALPVLLLGVMTVVLLTMVVVTVLRWGRPLSGPLFALRAGAVMPASLVALLCGGLLIRTVASRVRPRVATAATATTGSLREPMLVIDESGHIITTRAWHRGVQMTPLEEIPQVGHPARSHPRSRQWHPVHTHQRVNFFQHPDEGFLLAYNNASGLPLGCIGQDGLRAISCRPFGTPMQVLEGVSGFLPVITTRAVFAVDTVTGQVTEMHRGAVAGAARISLPAARPGFDLGVAIQSGADLLIASNAPMSEENEPQQGPTMRPACTGVVSDGRIEAVALGASFVGARVTHGASGTPELVVCRDGVVVERQDVPRANVMPSDLPKGPLSSDVPMSSDGYLGVRDAFFLTTLGPVLAEASPRVMRPYEHPAPAATRRRWGLVGAAISVVVMACALVAQRRRNLPRSQQVLGLLGCLLFGPAYCLSCLLLLSWRRPAAGALVM